MNITNRSGHPAFDPILSKQEVSTGLGVHISTLDRWILEGVFVPLIRLSANRVGFQKSDIEAWVAKRRSEAR